MKNNSSRRYFLKRSAKVIVGAIVLPQVIPSTALGMGGKLPPSDRIVMGAIGVGSKGTGDMNIFLRRTKETQVVAVCDVDTSHSDNAKKMVDRVYKNTDCRTYVDFREFLEKEKLDAVTIAIPDHWHGLIYSAAANKKLDVYGQKPLCRTVRDGQAIVKAVKKNNIVWQTGSQQRSDDVFRMAAELAINERIGKIKYVEVSLYDGGRGPGTPPVMKVPEQLNWDMWLGPAPSVPYRGVAHYNWRWILDYSGGQLTDWAGHHIDIALWGLGLDRSLPVEVSGNGIYPREGLYNVPVEFDFLCKYDNGVEMRVANSSRFRFGRGVKWHGENGWIHVDREGMRADGRWSNNGILKVSDPALLSEKTVDRAIQLYKSNDHYQNFLDCIRSRKETIAPVESGFNAIAAGLLGEIAMTTGKTIRVDAQNGEIIGCPEASRLLGRPSRYPWSETIQ